MRHEPPSGARTLFRGALILSQDESMGELIGDVLIDGDTIRAVGTSLDAVDADVVEAKGFALLPGFVDTHRHTWQTALRGLTVGDTLAQYQQKVQRRFGALYGPEDVFAGNLLGAVGALTSGITTLCDESHIQNSPAHTDAAVDALAASGIRAVFDYGWPSVESAEWMVDSKRLHPTYVRELQATRFGGRSTVGLVSLQMMVRGPVMTPMEVTRADMRFARELGLRMSIHVGRGSIEALHGAGLLGPDVTLIHCSDNSPDELGLLVSTGTCVSVAANIELNMAGLGAPPIRALMGLGIRPSLSVDVETTVGGDMFSTMRAALISQNAEEIYGSTAVEPSQRFDSRDVLGFATIEGARAAGLGERVGSITAGKQADLILIDLTDVNLAPATDAVGVIIGAGHAGNVDAVLVAGKPVKWAGRLTDYSLERRAVELATASRDRLVARAGSSH